MALMKIAWHGFVQASDVFQTSCHDPVCHIQDEGSQPSFFLRGRMHVFQEYGALIGINECLLMM